MAQNVATVEECMAQLEPVAKLAAASEYDEIMEFAKSKGHSGDLQPWDLPYWTNRLLEEGYGHDIMALASYFQFPEVLDGMLRLASKLFSIKFVRADVDAERWHPDVMVFKVLEKSTDDFIGTISLDPYFRPEDKSVSLEYATNGMLNGYPNAGISCNFNPPEPGEPACMHPDEVNIFLHEFGHALHFLFDRSEEEEDARGLEPDMLELPSLFMENWLFHKATVQSFTKHCVTGDRMPDEVFQMLRLRRTFVGGSRLLDQICTSHQDLELHSRDLKLAEEEPLDVYRRTKAKHSVLPVLDDDKLFCQNRNIFGLDKYASRYYQYVLCEVIAADAFEAFDEASREGEAALEALGRRWRGTVLARLGFQSVAELYPEFRGRNATVDALLRQYGLLESDRASPASSSPSPSSSSKGAPGSEQSQSKGFSSLQKQRRKQDKKKGKTKKVAGFR